MTCVAGLCIGLESKMIPIIRLRREEHFWLIHAGGLSAKRVLDWFGEFKTIAAGEAMRFDDWFALLVDGYGYGLHKVRFRFRDEHFLGRR